MECLNVGSAIEYIDQYCSAASKHAIETHIDRCVHCREFLAEIAKVQTQNDTEQVKVNGGSHGKTIGRYVLIDVVGFGAMGVVYLAYDPELDRKIAIKLLRNTTADEMASTRLRREAQAMAKVEHINVVKVFDVGTHKGVVYIALEFIDGKTLGSWLKSKHPSWRKIVEVLIDAGRGLEAAHNANLIHRDFKPENVLVSHDETRICVTDFGLVFSPVMSSAASPDIQRSRAGLLIGTPAYMAPEQWRSQKTDARSDQFNFCNCLFQLLYGTRPFPGDNINQLRAAVCSGKIQPVETPLPAQLHSIITRGLALNPENRFPSMKELLVELERIITPKPAFRRTGIILSTLIVGGAILALSPFGENQKQPSCEGAHAALAETWDSDRRAAIAAKIAPKQNSLSSGNHLFALLSKHGDSWIQQHRDACEATHVYGHQSKTLLEFRMTCLDDIRVEFDALLNEIGSSPTSSNDQAIVAATRLTPPKSCTHPRRILAQQASVSKDSTEHELFRWELAAVRAKMNLDEIETALEMSSELQSSLANVDTDFISIEADFLHATLLEKAGHLDDALSIYTALLPKAIAAQNEALVSELWIANVFLIGVTQRKFDEGRALAQVAQLALGRVKNRIDLSLQLQHFRAMISYSEGDFSQSEVLFRASLDAHKLHYGHTSPQTLTVQHNLGDTLQRQGKLEEARNVLEEVLTKREELYGTQHTRVASTLVELANDDYKRGNYRSALTGYRRSLSIRKQALGSDNPKTAVSHTGVGIVLRSLGQTKAAEVHHMRALSIWKSHFGHTHPTVALALNNLATVFHQEKRYLEARTCLEEAYEIKKNRLGKRHPEVAVTIFNLGEVVRDQKANCLLAKPYWQEALTIYDSTVDKKHPDIAFPLTSLGACYSSEKNFTKANILLERALKIRLDNKIDTILLAETQFALAKALFSSPKDRNRSLDLASQARDSYMAGSGHQEQVDSIDRWLKVVER